MNKSYDVYMCRESNQVDDYERTFKAMAKDAMDRGGYGGNSPVVNEWLEASWQRRVRQMKKETERQLSDAELLRSSPFDRIPSKIEMQGMKEIFKREYCFDDKKGA